VARPLLFSLEEPNLPQPNADSPAPSSVISSTTIYALITAYTTSELEQTTCIGYYGQNLCYRHEFLNQNLIACPEKLKKETLVEIEGIEYKCADRMAPRYWNQNRFDIYMGRGEDRIEEALEWGHRYLEVKIYEL